ncbi:MAG: hypothetical protein JSW36_09985, partial [Burkholderiales bacterium]
FFLSADDGPAICWCVFQSITDAPVEQTKPASILRMLGYPLDEIVALDFILDMFMASKNNLDFFDMMRRGG